MSRRKTHLVGFVSLVGLLLFSCAVHAQNAPTPTLGRFLGITQAFEGLRRATVNPRGNFPKFERPRAPKRIADPANLLSDNPAIKAAAEIKAQEDLAPQKIKAIKYLAEMGCGCYDKDGEITKAMVAVLGDCTEEVRLTAVEEIEKAAQCVECENCGESCCCGEDIVKALAKIAYERDEFGCWLEPSNRVREAAMRALCACCPNRLPPTIDEIPEAPREGPEGALPAPPDLDSVSFSSRRRHATGFPNQVTISDQILAPPRIQGRFVPAAAPTPSTSLVEPLHGSVTHIDLSAGIVKLQLDEELIMPPGTKVRVFHDYLTGRALLTELDVVSSQSGVAEARPTNLARFRKIARGDTVIIWP